MKPFAGIQEQVDDTRGPGALSNHAGEDDQVAEGGQLGPGKVEQGLGDGGTGEAYCDGSHKENDEESGGCHDRDEGVALYGMLRRRRIPGQRAVWVHDGESTFR